MLTGNSLNSLQQLETLELSGNRIYSLKVSQDLGETVPAMMVDEMW